MRSVDRVRAAGHGHLVPSWLTTRGQVEHVYSGAVTVNTEVGRWSILPAEAPDSPTGIRIESRDFHRWIAPGDRVTMRSSTLQVGAMLIDMRSSRRWTPTPWPQPLDDRIRPRARALEIAALAAGGAAWLVDVVDEILCGDDPSAAVRAAVGRGIGLTPSGDDALVGLLAALGAVPDGVDPRRRRAVRVSVLESLVRTTTLSGHFLALATAGHFHEPLHSTTAWCLGGGRRVAADTLLSMGATSGADAALALSRSLTHLVCRHSVGTTITHEKASA
jgi:Protein of unknown function (DUF2877)